MTNASSESTRSRSLTYGPPRHAHPFWPGLADAGSHLHATIRAHGYRRASWTTQAPPTLSGMLARPDTGTNQAWPWTALSPVYGSRVGRHAGSRRALEALDLPQPGRQRVPTGERQGHHLSLHDPGRRLSAEQSIERLAPPQSEPIEPAHGAARTTAAFSISRSHS